MSSWAEFRREFNPRVLLGALPFAIFGVVMFSNSLSMDSDLADKARTEAISVSWHKARGSALIEVEGKTYSCVNRSVFVLGPKPLYVRYDPKNPSHCRVEKDVGRVHVLGAVVGLASLALGLFIFFAGRVKE